MRHGGMGPEDGQWMRYGFLFADLFTALAMLFLLANTTGAGTSGTTTTSVSNQCGLDGRPLAPLTFTLSESDANALRKGNATAEESFSAKAFSAMTNEAGREVGLVQVYGGSYNGTADVPDGLTLAKGAIEALSGSAPSATLPAQGPILSQRNTLFQAFWDGDLTGQQVKVVMFLYAADCGSKLSG